MHKPLPPLLFLPHRIPYPPNKGDKLRSYHLLRYLTQFYSVHVGTFVDYAEDWQHVDKLSAMCASVHIENIVPRKEKIFALRGLLSGEALTLPYYRTRPMQAWVDATIRSYEIERVVVFSSSMAQYIAGKPGLRRVVDFCDVDSAKWAHYASDRYWPLSWLYRREAARLEDFERQMAREADINLFAADAETALFHKIAPESAAKTFTMSNGVDAILFSPQHALDNPYGAGERVLVFTGAMDYWPNIDAVVWFANEVWPLVAARHPDLRFYVVGMNPVAEIWALNGRNGITVTGSVPDVRPYLRHAAMVVAPLRIARGVQNKVLEAMAMARPVIVSHTCAQGLSARENEEYLVADGAGDYVRAIDALCDEELATATGGRARGRVLKDYSWDAHLMKLNEWIEVR